MRGLLFRRQHPVGSFILDFYCHEARLGIEVDGGIDTDTIKIAAKAGANVFVAGSAIFTQKDRKKAIDELRRNAENC